MKASEARIAGHVPVLVTEVLGQLQPVSGDILLDATIGHGGHAKAYLDRTAPGGRVVGLDADAEALAKAEHNLAGYGSRVQLIHANFAQLNDAARSLNSIKGVEGGGIITEEKSTFQTKPLGDTEQGANSQTKFSHMLFDLGIGSHQLADTRRGFSFTGRESLAMRYGDIDTLPVAQLESLNRLERELNRLPDVPDLLQRLKVAELAEVFRTYGEERYANHIAQAVHSGPLPETAAVLAEQISQAVPGSYRHGRIHPATRCFQALRLAVNRELEALQAALPQAVELLAPGGTIAVISFHSLEDRIVKHFFRQLSGKCVCPPEQPECTCSRQAVLEIKTRKPIQATESEQKRNPRARSAKLRAARKQGKTDS